MITSLALRRLLMVLLVILLDLGLVWGLGLLRGGLGIRVLEIKRGYAKMAVGLLLVSLIGDLGGRGIIIGLVLLLKLLLLMMILLLLILLLLLLLVMLLLLLLGWLRLVLMRLVLVEW